jgi:hypothetical protein
MIVAGIDFQYQSSGILRFNPGFGTKHYEPNWCIMELDEEIYKYYSWFMNMDGEPILKPNTLWGFHSSVIKGEEPTQNATDWAKFDGDVIPFYYSNYIKYSNGRHCWMDLYSPRLSEIRDYYGLYVNGGKLKYHMTLGRLKHPTVPEPQTATHLFKTGELHSV